MREAEAGAVHGEHVPSSRGRSRERNSLHNQRPPGFLHHQRRPHRFLQLVPHRARRFLRRGAADMGFGPTAELHPAVLHSNREGDLRSGGLRPDSRRPKVRGVTVQKTTQQTTETQVEVLLAPVENVGCVFHTSCMETV
ncbi:hypothetical protein V8G54_022596 [Vigna mungo]|uniref:Uncharacterized protein n=1 Tax=Vigna mungo TaxID=3915 RepID=A0AAQ3N3D6_VIGMU